MLTFFAPAVPGAGRGKRLGVPTVNLELAAIPTELEEGIHACMARVDGDAQWREAVLHFGPRPVFKAPPTCEVHFLDGIPAGVQPKNLTVRVVEKIRKVRNFPSTEKLKAQMHTDCEAAHAILQRRAASDQGQDRQ